MTVQTHPSLLYFWQRWGFRLATGAALLAALFFAANLAAADGPASFVTAKIKRGDLLSTISAAGPVEPEELVDVNAQLTGIIKDLGVDPSDPEKKKRVDYNTKVHAGTILAYIDDRVYRAQVEQAEATLRHARAELERLTVARDRARQQLKVAEAGRAAAGDNESARNRLAGTEADVTVAGATVDVDKAALTLAQTNLEYTVIRSPIEGVIIDRRVNVGQTVVASLSGASLFLIAKDLSNLQVWASVNEADIAHVRVGMPVQFTVDAYPNEVFHGKVAQVRLNAAVVQNVVTYTAVVAADNASGKLLPYMTANLQFVERHANVLLVPNAALRFKPRLNQVSPDAGAGAGVPDKNPFTPTFPRPDRERPAVKRPDRDRVWVEDGKFVRPVKVHIGESDGKMTEVSGDELKEGLEVIVGEKTVNPLGRIRELPAPVQRALASMGTNLLLVNSGSKSSSGVSFGSGAPSSLTRQDAEEITRQCPAVSDAAPIVRVRAQLIHGTRNWVPPYIYGTTPSYLAVRDWEKMSAGIMFSDRDARNNSRVCVIGDTIRRELFQGDSPLGQEIRIRNISFRVVGVLGKKGANVFGIDQDDIVLIPWTTAFGISGTASGTSTQANGPGGSAADGSSAPSPPSNVQARPPVWVDQILAKAASEAQIPQAIGQITELLRRRHRIGPDQADDFNIRDLSEIVKIMIQNQERAQRTTGH